MIRDPPERACGEAEPNGELTVKVSQEVEDALHGIHDLKEDAVSALDNLDDQERSHVNQDRWKQPKDLEHMKV